jgi:hypothetical protein
MALMLEALRHNRLLVLGLGFNWLLWWWAITQQPQWLSGAVACSNFLACIGFFRMSARLSALVQKIMIGMGVATGVLGLAELALLLQPLHPAFIAWLQEGLFMIGALMAAFYAFSLPGAIEQLRLYPHGVARRSVVGPLLAGGICTLVAWLFRPYFTPIALYTFIGFSLFFLFAYQVALMSQNRLRESLLRVMWGSALVSLARIVGGFEPEFWVTACFTFLWIAGMQVVASTALERPA